MPVISETVFRVCCEVCPARSARAETRMAAQQQAVLTLGWAHAPGERFWCPGHAHLAPRFNEGDKVTAEIDDVVVTGTVLQTCHTTANGQTGWMYDVVADGDDPENCYGLWDWELEAQP